jgi:hypothetical protein
MTADHSVATVKPSTNMITLCAIGATACLAADMVHEALGHGSISWLTNDPILSLSTVAIQNAHANRSVAAAGTLANVIVGSLSLLTLRRLHALSPLTYFVWVFGAFNLFNAGYLVASALMNNGDWSVVIAGLAPAWLWRCALAGSGLVFYVLIVRWVAACAVDFVRRGEIVAADCRRLVLSAYLAGGAVLTLASIFNPISLSLVLTSGLGASFGLNAGFLFVPGIVAARVRGGFARPDDSVALNGHTAATGSSAGNIPFSAFWLVLGLLSCGVFIGVLGPGIQFRQPTHPHARMNSHARPATNPPSFLGGDARMPSNQRGPWMSTRESGRGEPWYCLLKVDETPRAARFAAEQAAGWGAADSVAQPAVPPAPVRRARRRAPLVQSRAAARADFAYGAASKRGPRHRTWPPVRPDAPAGSSCS